MAIKNRKLRRRLAMLALATIYTMCVSAFVTYIVLGGSNVQ